MKTATVLTTALAVFALVPATWAAPQQHFDRDGDRYPDSRRMQHFAVIAQQIDDTATRIHEQFEGNNRRPNPSEEQAIAALHELNESASDFHESASRGGDAEQTQADFRVLLTSFYAAGEALRSTPRRAYVDRGMNRIHALMGELSRGFGRSSEFRDRGYGSRSHRWSSPDNHGG